jgi:hypothetical protein
MSINKIIDLREKYIVKINFHLKGYNKGDIDIFLDITNPLTKFSKTNVGYRISTVIYLLGGDSIFKLYI